MFNSFIGTEDNLRNYVGDSTEINFKPDPESRIASEKIILKEYNLKVNNTESGIDEFKLLAYVRDAQTGETLTADQDFTLEPCGTEESAIKFSEKSVSPGSPISVNLKGPNGGRCGYR